MRGLLPRHGRWRQEAQGRAETDRSRANGRCSRAEVAGEVLGSRVTGEGTTRIGAYEGYEVRFVVEVKQKENERAKSWGRAVSLPNPDDSNNGVTLFILGSTAAPELKEEKDLCIKGDLPVILKVVQVRQARPTVRSADRHVWKGQPRADRTDLFDYCPTGACHGYRFRRDCSGYLCRAGTVCDLPRRRTARWPSPRGRGGRKPAGLHQLQDRLDGADRAENIMSTFFHRLSARLKLNRPEGTRAGNFVTVERSITGKDGEYTLENFNVGFYSGKGTGRQGAPTGADSEARRAVGRRAEG